MRELVRALWAPARPPARREDRLQAALASETRREGPGSPLLVFELRVEASEFFLTSRR